MSQRLIRLGLGSLILLGVSVGAYAQGGPPPGPPPRGGFGQGGPGGPGGPGDFAFEGMIGNLGGKTVTGKPFSATISSEHMQKLQNGDVIDNTISGNIARDTSGRTHRQISLSHIGPLGSSGQPPHFVAITDPVAGMNYMLNVNKKTYQQFGLLRGRNAGNGANSGNPPTPKARPGETIETLPPMTVNGVFAQGTRITRTIPPGTEGNSSPIVITNERWYSPDLQMTVMETRNDPRFGTTTFQLTNIKQGDQDASLFTVPSDYTSQQGRRGPRGGLRGGNQPPSPPPPPPSGQD